MHQAQQHGDDLGLSEDETAFYDALANNKSAVEVMGDAQLAVIVREIIACELIQVVRILTSKNTRKNVSIDWTVKESAQARIRIVVKRILRKYGYPQVLLLLAECDCSIGHRAQQSVDRSARRWYTRSKRTC